MTYIEFLSSIGDLLPECPKNWREGQSVFNIVEAKYGEVARQVQCEDGIDCFYDNSLIDEFLQAVYKRITE